MKNLSIKTEIDKKPIYGFITGPLDYGETYKVSIFATTTTHEKGIYYLYYVINYQFKFTILMYYKIKFDTQEK